MFCCLFREEFIMLVIHLEAQFIMQDGQDESRFPAWASM
jgi:hypothetical protein